MFVPYVELHAHSAFSFLDGASSPQELAAAAVELGHGAMALTDHNGVSGSMEFAISAKALGLRAMELDVTGAFHSSMMAAAVPEFERALAGITFREPVTTVLSAVTAKPFTDPRRELADALTRPVRWREVMLMMHELGARRFVDVGPGRVLTGLAKRTLKDVELVNA